MRIGRAAAGLLLATFVDPSADESPQLVEHVLGEAPALNSRHAVTPRREALGPGAVSLSGGASASSNDRSGAAADPVVETGLDEGAAADVSVSDSDQGSVGSQASSDSAPSPAGIR